MKASIIFFLLLSMAVLKPLPLAYETVGFFRHAPRITIQQPLRISVLDRLDFFSAVGNSL